MPLDTVKRSTLFTCEDVYVQLDVSYSGANVRITAQLE